MSNASFPNPAEHCRSIGAGVGDKIRHGALVASELEIMCITEDSIAALDRTGKLHAMGPDKDITHRIKVEPPPVVSIMSPSSGLGVNLYVDRENSFGIDIYGNACNRFGETRAFEIARVGAEAIKAFIEAELGTGKDAAGAKSEPEYTANKCGNIYRNGVLIGWFAKSVATEDETGRFIAAGIAALNGERPEAEPVATQEGPRYTVDPSGYPSHDGQCVSCLVKDGEYNAGWVTIWLRAKDGKPDQEMATRHAHQIAAELNALHARANAKADQT